MPLGILDRNRHLHLDQVDFLSIFDKFDEGVIIVDTDGIISYYNDAISKIDDMAADFALGKKVTAVYELTEDTSMIMRCLKSRRPIINQTLFYRTRRGKVANTVHSVFPLYGHSGLTGAICFIKDYNVLEATLTSMSPVRSGIGNSSGAQFTFDDIIGTAVELQRCVLTAQMAANSPSPIMLYGETGTGKELFAQSIHNYSSRQKGRYIPVNCTAIPENLLEGILFGTVKGAFTGALDKPGLFEIANGGAIFLDEVNTMPIGLQAKILRVLQEKKVRRLGSPSEIDIDLKIISSVNREPHRDIEKNLLRPDLFYRLGVVFIRIPPLRERRDDISLLVEHFLMKLSSSHGLHLKGIGSRVLQAFHEYSWPGNVRELEHVIEGAMNILGEAEKIRLKHLPTYLRAESHPPVFSEPTPHTPLQPAAGVPSETADDVPKPREPQASAGYGGGHSLMETCGNVEKELLQRALADSHGNVTNAARQLGISRQLLHYKIRKFRLNRKAFLSS